MPISYERYVICSSAYGMIFTIWYAISKSDMSSGSGVEPMYCQKCGHENSNEAKFCAGCGKELHKSTKIKMIPVVVLACLLAGSGAGYMTDWTFQPAKEPPIKEVLEVSKEEKEIKSKKAPTVVNEMKRQSKEKTVLIKESLPSVFTVLTSTATGSGFLYKSGGYIITNAHVVAGHSNVTVRNSDGKDMEGQVIGISERYDIALIQSQGNKNVKAFVTEKKKRLSVPK